jgi:UDP-3-O-[3-hydroxymyristoyl] glucosamine N-acyltransferase
MKLPVEMSLGQIAHLIGGRVEGCAETKVSSFAPSPMQGKDGDIALLTDAKLVKRLSECKATAVILPEGTTCDRPSILVLRPNLAIQKILTALKPKRYFPEPGVHASAVVDPSAKLGDKVAIGPLVVIGPDTKIGANTIVNAGTIIGGGVEIGSDCLFHAGCLISDFVKIGNRVILQQGASIGGDGYGYVTERQSNLELRLAGRSDFSDDPNAHLKIPQIGTVIIEDDVEVGSNSTIDRATIGATVIGQGTKIDNLVQIAHNCRIGRESLIMAQAGIAGSSTVEERAIIAGHAGIKDHIHVGKDAIIEAMAGIMRDVPAAEVVVGCPAVPRGEFFKQVALTKKLPMMRHDMKTLTERVAKLEKLLLEK